MKITQVRNATQIIHFAGKSFLIDPLLAKKSSAIRQRKRSISLAILFGLNPLRITCIATSPASSL